MHNRINDNLDPKNKPRNPKNEAQGASKGGDNYWYAALLVLAVIVVGGLLFYANYMFKESAASAAISASAEIREMRETLKRIELKLDGRNH